MNLSLTVTQPPGSDTLGPDDVVLYRAGTVAGPPLFEAGADYEPVGPPVIVALYPEATIPPRYAALWARAFRLTQAAVERRGERDRTLALAENVGRRREALLDVASEVWPWLAADEWVIEDNGHLHDCLDLTFDDGERWWQVGERRHGEICAQVWGRDKAGVSATVPRDRLRDRLAQACRSYLGDPRCQAGKSARVDAGRAVRKVCLAAMEGE